MLLAEPGAHVLQKMIVANQVGNIRHDLLASGLDMCTQIPHQRQRWAERFHAAPHQTLDSRGIFGGHLAAYQYLAAIPGHDVEDNVSTGFTSAVDVQGVPAVVVQALLQLPDVSLMRGSKVVQK